MKTQRRARVPFTAKEAALIKGMIARGDKQSDIAAYIGDNGEVAA
jgi:hypothetical protein